MSYIEDENIELEYQSWKVDHRALKVLLDHAKNGELSIINRPLKNKKGKKYNGIFAKIELTSEEGNLYRLNIYESAYLIYRGAKNELLNSDK